MKKSMSLLEKKYKSAKLQIEKMKNSNMKMKEKVKRSTSTGFRQDRFINRKSKAVNVGSKINTVELKRMESHIESLKSELRYFQNQNEDLKIRMKEMQRNGESATIGKRYESEKGKNIYLENENIQLRKQIRDLNSKYKIYIDGKNRDTVGSFIQNKKTVNTREIEEIKLFSNGLKRENRDLKDRLQSLGNELKMKSNISEAISKKEYELETLKVNLASMNEENNYLNGNVMKMEMEIVSLKENLRLKEIELSRLGNGNDHMVKMYQKLYNDMKKECEIYMEKVRELSMKIQNGHFTGENITYTKNVTLGYPNKMSNGNNYHTSYSNNNRNQMKMYDSNHRKDSNNYLNHNKEASLMSDQNNLKKINDLNNPTYGGEYGIKERRHVEYKQNMKIVSGNKMNTHLSERGSNKLEESLLNQSNYRVNVQEHFGKNQK